MKCTFFDINTEIRELPPVKISLCAITKNEEQFIEVFLKNVQKYVDEIIIVDTGSSDATVEIAERFGARVFNHPWQDDFSAARNISLKYATGDWILVLDADERLVFKDELLLRRMISLPKSGNEINIFSFKQIHLYNEMIVSAIQYKDSFFENNKTLIFNKPIHEFMISENQELKINRLYVNEAEIMHYGNINEVRNKKQKQKRNVDILEKDLLSNPDDIHNLYYLASNYFEMGLTDKSLACISKALELTLTGQNIELGLLFNFYRILSSIYLDNGLYDNLIGLSKQVNNTFIQHPEILLNIGIAAYKKGDFSGALNFFEQGLENNSEKFYPSFLIINNNVSEKINYFKGLVNLEGKNIGLAVDCFLNSNINVINDSFLELEKLLVSDFSEIVYEKLLKYLEKNASMGGIRTLLSNYYMKNEEFIQAIEILQLNNFDKGLILDIAELSLKRNENKKVIALCNYFQEKYGQNLKLLKLRSQAYINIEIFNEAGKDLYKAVEQARWDKELLEKLISILPMFAPQDLEIFQERLEKIK